MSRLWRTDARTVESNAVFSLSWIRNTDIPGETVQLVVDTGSFRGGGLGPPNLFKICQPWLLERGQKECFNEGKYWGKQTSHPIQATNASPVRNPITAPRSSTRLKVGSLHWCDGFSNEIVFFSYFYYVYVHISSQKTHLARTPRVKRPNRGPPTTPNMVKEACTRLLMKVLKKFQEG